MQSRVIKRDIEEIVSEIMPDLKRFDGKTVLITGANGFLGSYITDTLAHYNTKTQNPCLLVLINKNPVTNESRLGHLLGNPNVQFVTKDVSKPFYIKQGKVNFIFHAASNASIRAVATDPEGTLEANRNGLKVLLNYAKENPVEEFLFFSSGDIYGNPTKDFLPTPETYPGNVNTLAEKASYTEAKRVGETMCMDAFRTDKVPIKLLRIFNTYGPGLRNDGKVVANFFITAEKDGFILINNDGRARRSMSYVSDTIRGIFKVVSSGKPGEAYNIGTNENNPDMLDLSSNIMRTLKRNVSVLPKPISTKPEIGENNRYPDIRKLKGLGFSPRVSLEDGLTRMREHYDETGYK